jgi:restriction endonuclease Mrr
MPSNPTSTLPPVASQPSSPGERRTIPQPALDQLRTLSVVELDTLILSWLRRLRLAPARRSESRAGATTYHALFEHSLFPLPVRVRIHQRKNRLQPHHVEAFAGHLVRCGVSTGVLVTTGECSRGATQVASAYITPRVRLLGGGEWLQLLRPHGVGLRRARLWHWLLDRTCLRRKLRSERRGR